MKKLCIIPLILLILSVGVTGARAAGIALYDWAFNINGDLILYPDVAPLSPSPASIDDGAFDWTTGLGTLEISFDPGVAGDYFFLAFFDHEIDETDNTSYNEIGEAVGIPDGGQSWEIDEPGWVSGDIYDNVTGFDPYGNSVPVGLDNQIGYSIYGNTIFPDDVSMAMGWNFSLLDGETATIGLLLSNIAPTSGFYLHQSDPDSSNDGLDSPYDIYFSSTLSIQGETGPAPVPEPATLLLLGSGLVGLFGMGKKKFSEKIG
jgi:hypothetical protein